MKDDAPVVWLLATLVAVGIVLAASLIALVVSP